MDMDMTIFMDPFKAKISVAMPLTILETESLQPMRERYMTIDEKGYTTYTGMNDVRAAIAFLLYRDFLFSKTIPLEQ